MHAYSFGIEEEYFLVNRQTAALKCELPKSFMTAAQRKLGEQLTTELLQSQIEVMTPPLQQSSHAIEALRSYRSTLAEVGKAHGIGIVASGTHPQAQPDQQRMTRKRRYSKVINDLGMVGLGNPISGLHVHVEVPDPDARVEIMHRLIPFLPFLLAHPPLLRFGAATRPASLDIAMPRMTLCRVPVFPRRSAASRSTRPISGP